MSYLPSQRLTDSQKITQYGSVEQWGEDVIKSIFNLSGYTSYGSIDCYDIQTNLDLYYGYLNVKDLEYVTNPYGMQHANFPAELKNYNIIKPKVDLLVGEEIKRPFNFKVISVNPDAVTHIEAAKKEMVLKMLQDIFVQEAYKQGMVEDPADVPEQVMEYDQIKSFLETSYSDMREILGQQSLDYLIWYCDLKTKFNKGFKEYLITGTEIYYTGLIAGEPACMSVDPRNFYAEVSSDTTYIEDAQYCYYQRYLTPADIHDQFYDVLTEKQVQQIEDIRSGHNFVNIGDTNLGVPITYSDIDMSSKSVYNNNNLIRVVHICWQSLRKIGFLTYIDPETGEEQETIVDETYKINKEFGESVDWKWINEVWEGTRIGSDIYVNVRPIPNQSKSLDNPSKCKLPYTGVYKHQALVSIMKPHQYFYDILMYRLELSLARSGDKAMVMDIAQIPRSMGIDTEKWMYYLKTLGIAFINSFEEGTGRNAGKNPSFNQFQSIDMSLSNVMNQYIEMMAKVEDMIGEISGVSRQRQGQVNTSELVGNVERSVVQSSNITEPMFYTHSEIKRRVLTNLIEVSKLAWMNGKKGQYITEDLQRVYFNIDGPEYADSEFGIFVSNSSKDDRIIETLRQLAQGAVQAGTVSLKGIADILSTDSIANIKRKLGQAEAEQHAKQMELEQQKQQGAQQQMQLQLQDKDADRQVQIDNNIRDNETKLAIAGMSNDEGQEAPEDNTHKVIAEQNKLHVEYEKLNIEKEKANAQKQLDNQYLELERDKVKHDMKIDEKELVIKRIAANKKPAGPKK